MKRKSNTTTLRLGQVAHDMVTHVAHNTGWSRNVATNRLIELGMHGLIRRQPRIEESIATIELAMQAHAIAQEAAIRIAALKNLKPKKVSK